ncbi:MAG: nucleotidyltransferase domain-containing protein [Chloroflexota bacterium]
MKACPECFAIEGRKWQSQRRSKKKRLLYNSDMATPVLNLSHGKLAQYRRTAISRQKARAPKVKLRMKKAWKLAKQAAGILRKQYHAERVAVFGSLLHETRFTQWSDVDIAAWGIPAEETFRAIGAVMDLDSSLEINLVDINTCTPSLLKAIEQEAVDV